MQITPTASQNRARKPSPERQNTRKRTRWDHKPNRDRVYLTSEENVDTNESTVKCGYCESSSHRVIDCDKFTRLSISDRWNWASENRVCFRCLISNEHRQSKCREMGCNITKCRGTHHRLLHRVKNKSVDSETSNLREEALNSRRTKQPDI